MLATVLGHPFVIHSLLTATAKGFKNRKDTNDYKIKVIIFFKWLVYLI